MGRAAGACGCLFSGPESPSFQSLEGGRGLLQQLRSPHTCHPTLSLCLEQSELQPWHLSERLPLYDCLQTLETRNCTPAPPPTASQGACLGRGLRCGYRACPLRIAARLLLFLTAQLPHGAPNLKPSRSPGLPGPGVSAQLFQGCPRHTIRGRPPPTPLSAQVPLVWEAQNGLDLSTKVGLGAGGEEGPPS